MLSSLISFGEILWLDKILIYYRVHDSNDSAIESVSDRIRLMNYMKKKILIKNPLTLYYSEFYFGLDGLINKV